MYGAPYPFLLLPNGPRNLQVVDLPIPSVLPRLARTVEVHHRPPGETHIGPVLEVSLCGDGELRPLYAPTITDGNGDQAVVTRERYSLAYASRDIPVDNCVVDFDVHEDTGDIVHHDDCRRGGTGVLVWTPINHRGLTENDRRPGRRDAPRRRDGEKDEKDQSGCGHNASNGKGWLSVFSMYIISYLLSFCQYMMLSLEGVKKGAKIRLNHKLLWS